MRNYFAFIDESGNSSIERYFGLGMILVDDVGVLYDSIKPHYSKALDIAKIQKEKRINDLIKNQNYKELAAIAKSGKRFELKFKFINFTNNSIYKEIINNYFQFPQSRCKAAIIDRKDPNFRPNELFDSPWYMYMSYAAMLLSSDINNLGECRICILADDLTKPRNILETFEEALTNKISSKLKQGGIETVFNVARLESHSSLMLQLVDILLGCVMYDFKKNAGLISEKLSQRQEIVVEQARRILKRDSLSQHFTVNQPSYFNVWKLNWKK